MTQTTFSPRWEPQQLAVILSILAALYSLGVGVGPAHADTLDRAAVVSLAAETFGPEVAEYVANIARCESSYRTAVDTNWPYVGLLQIDATLWTGTSLRLFGSGDFTDPRVNMKMAAWIANTYGFSAWPVCSR